MNVKTTKIDVKDAASGLAISLLGLFFFLNSFKYGLGTLQRMGPGMFPMLVGAITIFVGQIVMIPAFRRPGTVEKIAWRPILAVLGSVVAFGVAFIFLGLLPATFLSICVCSLAATPVRPMQIGLLAAGTTIGAWLIFIQGLGLQVPAFRAL